MAPSLLTIVLIGQNRPKLGLRWHNCVQPYLQWPHGLSRRAKVGVPTVISVPSLGKGCTEANGHKHRQGDSLPQPRHGEGGDLPRLRHGVPYVAVLRQVVRRPGRMYVYMLPLSLPHAYDQAGAMHRRERGLSLRAVALAWLAQCTVHNSTRNRTRTVHY